ncbi:ArpU family phage packaging/lysis transcriptional regulator [Paenibacillus ginsengarvi]|uniref:ArpU family transcriptional regulator n=1 Tax=Paenibacillus ginsengarvi TaxID=400777 RepID=A0A3B0BQ87_9BACL|nr:ArpU family phage packaging/lysis transcriptional regulator [Paenibacillus ginsengarvi]RKN75022.1 ArpU family transcriptional regulator [Paenibacillus ginsengarvi]
MAQMQFPFEIDREATRTAVEERLESARIYKQVGFIRREIQTTTSWTPRFHGNTNAISKATEDTAVHNVDMEESEHQRYEQVIRAVSRLGRIEREIIERRYLEDEVFDYQVMMDMDIREGRYYKIKSSAVYKLAFALRLEVYAPGQE